MSLIVFRADAGLAIGSGHVMRSLALARAFSSHGWQVGFAATKETFESVASLDASNFDRVILDTPVEEEPSAIKAKWPFIDILVVDHYGRDAVFERACRAFAKRLVVVDDLADRQHDCDLLIDSNASSEAAYGSLVPEGCDVLVGPAYAPLHSEFRRLRAATLKARESRPATRALVCFGQMDAHNATEMTLDALKKMDFHGPTDVAIGRAAPHLARLRERAGEFVKLHIDASNMPELMAAADFAIGAGGTTTWERCCLGLPGLVVELADNQRGVIKMIEQKKASISLGSIEDLGPEKIGTAFRELLADWQNLLRMSKASAMLVDGRGSDRIVLASIGSETTKAGKEINLRLCEAGDETWLLALQRRRETRRYFHNPKIPSDVEHREWMSSTLADQNVLLAIVEIENKPVGTVRLDRLADYDKRPRFMVSIAVEPDLQKQGIGAAALKLIRRVAPGSVLDAEVFSINESSQIIFRSSGYVNVAGDLYRSLPK